MSNTDILKQKVKGKLQKAKGEFQKSFSAEDDLGMKFKGGISKIKGETNEMIADFKSKMKKDINDAKRNEKEEIKDY